jgi:hypothetical protein
MIRSSLFVFICLLQAVCGIAQLSQNDSLINRQSSVGDSISMPISTKYKASASKEFFGENITGKNGERS